MSIPWIRARYMIQFSLRLETATSERPYEVTEVIRRQVLFHTALTGRYEISIPIINSSAAPTTYSLIDNFITCVLSAYAGGSLLQFIHTGFWFLLWNFKWWKEINILIIYVSDKWMPPHNFTAKKVIYLSEIFVCACKGQSFFSQCCEIASAF